MKFSHIDEQGKARMVDVSSKPSTQRRAVARGFVRLPARTVELLREKALPKGDVLTVAQVAGILGAKRAGELIPMCHPLALTHAGVRLASTDAGVEITAEAATNAPTGVEMEAITAVVVAAITVYDMCKGVDPDITIEGIQLLEKTGGKRDWRRSSGQTSE